MKLRGGPAVIIGAIHEALLKYGEDGAAVSQLVEDTEFTSKQVHACIRRDSGWFKVIRDKKPNIVIALPRPEKRVSTFPPVIGGKRRYRLENEAHEAQQAYQASQPSEDAYGRWEVRYTNSAGMTICQPAYSWGWAKILQSENEGSIIVEMGQDE